MIVNRAGLSALFTGFNTAFTAAFEGAESHYRAITMVVKSGTAEEEYGFLGQVPGVREWVGPRHVKNLSLHGFTIKNRKFESTVGVPREKIEDDRFGVFTPTFQEMGRAAATHPDQLVFALLKEGFSTICYDGQNFFDAEHPVGDDAQAPQTSVSNVQDGEEEPWFLLDTSRAIKPMLYQERVPYRLQALDNDGDENVFFQDEYIYGVRGRSNVGFGLWQLAFASKAALTPENYESARAAMMSFKGDEGRPLGIKPDTLVVPPSLEGAAMRLLNNGTRVIEVGDTPVAIQNEWAGTAKPIVTAWAA